MTAELTPGQPPDDTILVPIDVQALVTGTGKESVPTETRIPIVPPGTPESATLPVPPPLFASPTPRAPGVHLHWAMPDGLTRGDAIAAGTDPVPAGNPMALRPLPDRWLVVRMLHSQETTRSWVLLADRGEHHDLAGWTDPGPPVAGTDSGATGRRVFAPAELTAVAGGDVAWAATYDAVVDRFAFHDDLAGVAPTEMITYLVAGWWSNVDNNPLANLGGVAHQRVFRYWRRMQELGWEIPIPNTFPPPPPPQVPPFVLLYGVLCGVTADGGQAPDLKPKPTDVGVALGGSGFGAFAALLAQGTEQQRDASERVLAAFNSGLLARVDTPDGLVAVDEDRHAATFVGSSDGVSPTPDVVAEGDRFHTPDTDTTPPTVPPPPEILGVELRRRDAHAVLSAARAQTSDGDPSDPGPVTFREVPTARPRLFTPADLALVLQGAGRNLRHGGDGRFNARGELIVRFAHHLVLEIGGIITEADLPPGLRLLGSTAIPKECDWLLRETVLLDPYRADDRHRWIPPELAGAAAAARLRAEAVLRHPPEGSPFQPRPDADGSALLVRTALVLPPEDDPSGMPRWCQPWVPLWCEWQLAVRVDEDLARWVLGPIDLLPRRTPDADPSTEAIISGRTQLHASASQAFAAQVTAWLDEEHRRDQAGEGQASPETEAALAAAAAAAGGMDVLMGTFAGLRETLLGLDPKRAGTVRITAAGLPASKPPAAALPKLLTGGGAVVKRLRVVDAFGRCVDVDDTRLARMEVASTHRHPAPGARVVLAPRFQAPARLELRFIDPERSDLAEPVEARIDQQHPENTISPVAGWLLPDHVDEALECFDPDGAPLGQLMHDPLSGAVVWETAPGRPGPIAGPPDPGDRAAARHVTRWAAGVVQADATARHDPATPPTAGSALSALLRGIDTTMWSVDPLGSIGTAAVAGLVGRPIAVVRAVLRLELVADADQVSYPRGAPDQAARRRAFAEAARHSVAVRLGELTRTDDGLLAFAVDDRYEHLRLVAPEVRDGIRSVADPIPHPYVAGPTDVSIHPGQEIRLTLLLSPGGKVHVTSGVLPRKGLALARDWFHAALERISPSFRVGPVLVDPTGVRMPRVTGLGYRQVFTRRVTPLTWRDDPILAASQTALLPDDPSGLQEGWIRVVPTREEPGP